MAQRYPDVFIRCLSLPLRRFRLQRIFESEQLHKVVITDAELFKIIGVLATSTTLAWISLELESSRAHSTFGVCPPGLRLELTRAFLFRAVIAGFLIAWNVVGSPTPVIAR